MTDTIESMITEKLQGKADYDVNQLLRVARDEIVRLRKDNSDMGWAIDFHADRAAQSESRHAW